LWAWCALAPAAWARQAVEPDPPPARPQVADRPTTAALAARVVIRRDTFGVPHIRAESLRAAAFGFGYAQAEDHALGLSRKALAATGRMSEYFGVEHLAADLFARRYGIADPAALDRVPPEARAMLESFADGFNFYIHRRRAELPPWVNPISAADALAVNRSELARFAFNRGRSIERLRRRVDGRPEVAEVEEAALGSNMWALAPERSASGAAMLMGNPHQPWSDVFYEAHLTVPGELNVYGAAFVGGVAPVLAFNDRLGWSHTVNDPDLEDIYELRLDPERADSYLFDGESIPFEPYEVAVKVAEGESMREERRTYWRTPIGPVVHRTADRAYAIKSSALDEVGAIQAWLDMSRARDLAQFEAALDSNAIPMFNVAYADVDGNILYRWLARLPRRPEGRNGDDPTPANGAADVWQELHAPGELPRLLNPPGGYVQNSNDPPWFTTLHLPLDPARHPSAIPAPRLGLRSQHGLELIHNRKKFTLEEIAALKNGAKMLLADRLRDDLVAALRNGEGRAAGAPPEAAALLGAWDGTVTPKSRGPVLFELWWREYRRSTSTPWRIPWSADDPAATPRGLGDPAAAVAALNAAVAETVRRFGAMDVAWGEVHRARRGDLDLPIAGGSGELGFFRVLDFDAAADGKLVVSGGDGFVFAVEFAPTGPRALSILAYGQNERPGSLHHADQLALFAEGRMKTVNFTEEQIQANLSLSYRPGER
jgi:acyl-homoserine-lactone acylase